VFIGALGGHIYPRVPKFLDLDPDEYCYDACSRDADAVNSDKGKELDRRLRDYCADRTCDEVEKAFNHARISCTRVFNARDQYQDVHYAAREMTVPVVDHQSGVPIRVYGVVPKMSLTPGRIWRGAPSIGEDTTDILTRILNLGDAEIGDLYRDGAVHRTEPFTEAAVDAVNP
jgi:crotonobetainyl-CoA:carnitine CoA-transferase CaiB-like acyl-CoA transferase